MADAPNFSPISVSGNRVPGERAVSTNSNIGPNFNDGGYADNGPGTGGWSPSKASAAPKSSSSIYKPRGLASSFDSSKYTIDQLQYPSDLMSATNEYGGNYAIFYINVSTDSKLIREGVEQTVDDIPPRDQGSLVGLASNSLPGVTEQINLGIAKGTSYANKTFDKSYNSVGAQNVVSAVGSRLSGQKKRIKTAIALHVPNNLSTSYNISYDEDDMNMAALLLAGAGGGAALMKAIETGNYSNVNAGDMAKSAGAAVGSTVMQAGNIAGLGGSIQKLTGLAPNPRKEQIFKNVSFRKFQFDYEFFPRDAHESQNVLNIIYQFKLHMHPEFKDANQFLYIYPSEFDIFYYNNGTENMNINRHTSCVLTDMTVNYSPQGQFTTFEGGMPTQINVSLSFMELATLTKEKIQDGL
jgi:hypothetical protein